jgi:hypothetical protein
MRIALTNERKHCPPFAENSQQGNPITFQVEYRVHQSSQGQPKHEESGTKEQDYGRAESL